MTQDEVPASPKDAALKLALEALVDAAYCVQKNYCPDKMGHDWDDTITAIKEALAQPEQEPYCYVDPVHLAALNTDQSAEVVLHKNPSGYAARGLYTAPQQRPWVGLTDEEVDRASANIPQKYKLAIMTGMHIAQKILKEKNT